MKQIFTSIDIGSDKIKVLVCEMHKNTLHVLAATSIESRGLKRDLIIDTGLATSSIKKAFKEAEEMLGVTIDKTVVTIPIYHAEMTIVSGYSTITNDEKEIRGNDIVRALQASVYNKLDANKELVNIIPLEFNVDDKKGIRDPKGLIGDKLEVNALMITVPKKNVESVVSAIEAAGVKTIDIIVSGMADYAAFKTTHTETEAGVIVNIGSETTSVSVFNKGVLLKGEVLPIGSKNIDKDIGYIYKTDLEQARKIKEEFAIAHKKLAEQNELYDIINNMKEKVTIKQVEVSEIVMSRLREILNLSKKQIKLLTNREISYIIVTGGITEMPGFIYVVKEIFGENGTIGKMKTMGIRHNMYSSALGAMKTFYEKLSLRGKIYSMFDEAAEKDLISSKKRMINFTDDSVIGKVFGYFFEG